jgi:hypothetical protein
MKSLINIKFREDLSPTNSCQGLINKGERVPVLTGDIIKLLVVDAEP